MNAGSVIDLITAIQEAPPYDQALNRSRESGDLLYTEAQMDNMDFSTPSQFYDYLADKVWSLRYGGPAVYQLLRCYLRKQVDMGVFPAVVDMSLFLAAREGMPMNFTDDDWKVRAVAAFAYDASKELCLELTANDVDKVVELLHRDQGNLPC